MAGDDFGVVYIQSGNLRTHTGDEFVARPMEAVTTHAIFLVILVWQGIDVIFGRNGLMERRVEYGNLLDIRQNLVDGLYAFQIGRIVQRCNVEERTHLLFDLFGYDARIREQLASVYHTVADSLQLVERAYYAVLLVGQCCQYEAYARGVVGNRLVQFERLFAYGLVRQIALCQADALDQTLRQQRVAVVVDVDYLILNR